MLDHLFPRLGSQFREGGIVHVKFLVSSGPVFAAKASRPGSFHKRLTLTKTATGKVQLVLTGGAREVALLAAHYVNIQDPTDVTDCMRICPITAWTESTGTIDLLVISGDGAEAATDPAAGDEIHITLYVGK
jgi:hypothetical protein